MLHKATVCFSSNFFPSAPSVTKTAIIGMVAIFFISIGALLLNLYSLSNGVGITMTMLGVGFAVACCLRLRQHGKHKQEIHPSSPTSKAIRFREVVESHPAMSNLLNLRDFNDIPTLNDDQVNLFLGEINSSDKKEIMKIFEHHAQPIIKGCFSRTTWFIGLRFTWSPKDETHHGFIRIINILNKSGDGLRSWRAKGFLLGIHRSLDFQEISEGTTPYQWLNRLLNNRDCGLLNKTDKKWEETEDLGCRLWDPLEF